MSGPFHKARNAAATAIVLWLLALWVSPAATALLEQSGSSTSAHSCCRHGRAECCKRTHTSDSGPRISSASCPNACGAIGKFLPAKFAPFVLSGVRVRANLVSHAADHREPARSAASISLAALFERPPPSC